MSAINYDYFLSIRFLTKKQIIKIKNDNWLFTFSLYPIL